MKKIILGVLFFISCLFANEIKFDMNFTKDTSCEIRKIKLYQNPIWASKIEFKNGKNAFFCSPKSMFEFYFNEEKWKIFEIASPSDFTNILITDYKTSKIVDAKKILDNSSGKGINDLYIVEDKVGNLSVMTLSEYIEYRKRATN